MKKKNDEEEKIWVDDFEGEGPREISLEAVKKGAIILILPKKKKQEKE